MGLGEGKGRTQLNGFRVFRSLFSHAAGKAGPWELWQAGAALSFLVSLSLSHKNHVHWPYLLYQSH